MAIKKDPAFLFYAQDFLVGTILMTDAQIGKYIKLLCIQHQHGGLIDKTAFNNMVNGDKIIEDKFVKTDDGYYNDRLMDEIVKRKKKSENLSANAKKRWEDANGMQLHKNTDAKRMQLDMPIEDENENENEDVVVVEGLNVINNNNGLTKIGKLFISTWQRKPKNLSEILAVEKMFLDYSEAHIIQSFRRAAEQDVMKVAYVKGILKKHYEKLAKNKAIKEAKKKALETQGVNLKDILKGGNQYG